MPVLIYPAFYNRLRIATLLERGLGLPLRFAPSYTVEIGSLPCLFLKLSLFNRMFK